MLTGDKQETAISIGFSCLLLTRDMQQIIINEVTQEGCREAIRNAKVTYGVLSASKSRRFSFGRQNNAELSGRSSSERALGSSMVTAGSVFMSARSEISSGAASRRAKGDQSLALIIDGNSLVHALSPDLEQEVRILTPLYCHASSKWFYDPATSNDNSMSKHYLSGIYVILPLVQIFGVRLVRWSFEDNAQLTWRY